MQEIPDFREKTFKTLIVKIMFKYFRVLGKIEGIYHIELKEFSDSADMDVTFMMFFLSKTQEKFWILFSEIF